MIFQAEDSHTDFSTVRICFDVDTESTNNSQRKALVIE